MMPDKGSLRAEMRARRRALPAPELARAEAEAAIHLLAWEGWRASRALALHCATRGELPTLALLVAARAAGKRLALPRSGPYGMELRWVADDDALAIGAHGIAEPPASAPLADPAALDLVLTPGLAFDRDGRRLGQGGGDYDRLLAALPARTAVVGWCHDFQIAATVPTEPHDRRVGWLATPSGLRRAGE